MEAIILLGAPGAGKGTVAESLKAATDYRHVSTGDMLREAVRQGHPVGLQAKSYMERGELVPDEVIVGLVADRLDRDEDGAHYMFDGFPRTLHQAELLDDALKARGGRVAHVFLLEVGRELLVWRIAGRRVCRKCGAVYHVLNIPPRVQGVCDQCGGELYQRPDDNEATVVNRLDVYEKQTAALIDYYRRRGVLAAVDGTDRQSCVDAICRVLTGSRP
jgi:adenylate kinase